MPVIAIEDQIKKGTGMAKDSYIDITETLRLESAMGRVLRFK
jgi:hypothetical protein